MSWTYVTVACTSDKRWFDLDAVREPFADITIKNKGGPQQARQGPKSSRDNPGPRGDYSQPLNPAGAPPLDWHDDNTPQPPDNPGAAMPPSTVTYHVGDVRDRMADIPDHTIDLIVTSPPFLALRSYLPADHPDKHREIGSEPTPAQFLDTLLELTADWRRLLTPTGSLCVELGDTYSGTNPKAALDAETWRGDGGIDGGLGVGRCNLKTGGKDWPLAKSLCGIPALYQIALAYGINPLTGAPSPAGQWRIRNLLVWTRPNPPVGALGDKWRPATSYVTVATASANRWFDLDAVRDTGKPPNLTPRAGWKEIANPDRGTNTMGTGDNPAGAPPLDWHHDDTADWQPLHRLPTATYPGAHYATYPLALPRKLIEAMCPREVCQVCGEPRRRLVTVDYTPHGDAAQQNAEAYGQSHPGTYRVAQAMPLGRATKHVETLGWSDCGHNHYSPGHVLDPFAGSGTTLLAAALTGRNATGIDIDARNRDLTYARLADACLVTYAGTPDTGCVWTVHPDLPGLKGEHPDQASLFDDGDPSWRCRL